MGYDGDYIDGLAINLENQQTRFRPDSCFFQHRAANPSFDPEVSFSIRSTRESHKLVLLTCDVAFDARFLYSYHLAAVQVQLSVNLVDGVVCVDSSLVTA